MRPERDKYKYKQVLVAGALLVALLAAAAAAVGAFLAAPYPEDDE